MGLLKGYNMSDYISKSAIVDRLSEEAKRLAEIAIHSKGQAADYYTGRKTGFAKAAIIANGFPTIDAVPVVRCKDCKWATNEPYRGDDVWICNFNQWRRVQGKRKPDFFCANGERRDDE